MVSFLRLLRVVLLLSAILVACQSETPSLTGPKSFTATSPPARTLIVWHALAGDERAALEEIRRDFETAHPTVDVQLSSVPAASLLESFRQQVLVGAGPDLLIIPRVSLPTLARQGLIQALDDSLLKTITDRQTEIAFAAGTYDGLPYGLALATEFPTLYYRRSLVAPSFTSATELLSQAESAGMVVPSVFVATGGLLLNTDANPFDADGPAPASLAFYFRTLARLAASPAVHFTTDRSAFEQGEAALLVASSDDYGQLSALLGADLGVAAWPSQDWPVPVNADPVIVVSLNITRSSATAANEFLAYLVSPDAQALWFERTGKAPVNPFALTEPGLAAAWSSALRRGLPLPLEPDDVPQKLVVLDTMVAAVVGDRLSPEKAVEQALEYFSQVTTSPAP